MKNMKNRLRQVLLPFLTALFASALFFATSCNKNETDQNQPLKYTLQDIPNIQEIIPKDLLEAIGNEHLHFGNNPPKLCFDSTGFVKKNVLVKRFIQHDSSTVYTMADNEIKHYTNYLRFQDQHRGVAKYNYKCVHLDTIYFEGGPRQYYIEYANRADSVFIMGDGNLFTAYLVQDRHKKSSIPTIVDYGSHEYIVLTGEITNNGIKDLYFGLKIKGYDNPADAGYTCLNINDIVVFYIDFLPLQYWNPSQH